MFQRYPIVLPHKIDLFLEIELSGRLDRNEMLIVTSCAESCGSGIFAIVCDLCRKPQRIVSISAGIWGLGFLCSFIQINIQHRIKAFIKGCF